MSEVDTRRALRRSAATLLTTLFLLALGSFGAAAQAQSGGTAANTPSRLRLDVDQVTPVITSTSTSFSVTGRVTNTGDRRISKLLVRLQVGNRVTTEREFTDALANGAADTTQPQFTSITESLEPGQSAPVQISLPFGSAAGAMKLSKPGVYPVLMNVNGTPEFGGQTRLAAVNLLVPVLGVPGKAPEHQQKASPVSVLWPIADTIPHVATWAQPLGGQLVLTDDELAADLSPGGRLDSLVSAAQAAKETSPHVFSSLCLAIDPDLLSVVDGMSRGYQVQTGQDTPPATGRGTPAAQNWLTALKQLTSQNSCVVPLPFADANLSTLSQVHAGSAQDADLVTSAVSGAATLTRLLGVAPRAGVLWPAGTMDTKTLGLLGNAGIQTVLTNEARQGGEPATTAASLNGTQVRGQPIDPLVSAAFAGMPGNAQLAGTPTQVNLTPAGDEPAVSTQDGLAALAFRSGLGQATAAQHANPILLAPPRRWNVPAAELTTLLDQLAAFTNAGVVQPQTLSELLAPGPGDNTATMATSADDLTSPPAGDGAAALSDLDTSTAGFAGAMKLNTNTSTRVGPGELIKPVRDGLIRASSVAWQGAGGGSAITTANARGELNVLRAAVTVVAPSQRLSLSDSAPLPVFVSNSLPVDVTVQVLLKNNAGLRPENISTYTIPAGRKINQLVNFGEALRAGRLSVDVSLSTPSGLDLGTTARFELSSNNYGVITIIVTAAAGGALLLLSARRIYRRVRDAKAARADGH